LPEATAQVMHGGWLKTGDLASCDDGFYTIAGRKKNVIIRGGVNVYPDDVNSVLLNLPGVNAATTIGVPDVFLGELVVSAVMLNGNGVGDHITDELMAQCRAELSGEKVPNRIVVVDDLPYGPSGKIEIPRVVLMVTELLGASVEGANARDQVLHLAARVFGQPVETLSGASNSGTTLGWDSLSFLELIIGLERQFDMSIAPRDVMTLRSLDDAVALVEDR
jgi:acyl carrier protein